MKNWNQVELVPEFNEQGVACYKLAGGNYVNEYYVVSEAETRKLLNTPEIVGYEVYDCLIPSTSQMLYYFKEQKKVTTANILSILRGALNYPLEESCYREHIRVHDISFLSSERVLSGERTILEGCVELTGKCLMIVCLFVPVYIRLKRKSRGSLK